MTTAALALVPTNIEEGKQLAVMLSNSTLIPEALRGKPSDVLVVLMTGAEMGLGPLQALRGISVVKGKPVLSAELLVALVQRSPACEYFMFTTSTSESCTYKTLRRGHPQPVELTWTMADATRGGLANSNTYRQYPAAMLRARCSAALVRAVYPDLALGFLVDEEAEEIRAKEPIRALRPVPAAAENVIDAEVDEPPAEDMEQQVLLDDGRLALQEGMWDVAAAIGKKLHGDYKTTFATEYKAAKAATKGAAGVKAQLKKQTEAPVEREPGEEG